MAVNRETLRRVLPNDVTAGSMQPGRRRLFWGACLTVFGMLVVVGCRGAVSKPCEGGLSQHQADQLLLHAIQGEDIDEVRHALACGANANRREEEKPVLWYTIQRGNVIVVRELLKAGASVHARISLTEGGDSMLSAAAGVSSPQSVKALLVAGADPNERSGAHKNLTPVGRAAISNQPWNCEALINAGADPNSWNMWPEVEYAGQEFEPGVARGKTPLMLAAMRGNAGAVFTLLRLGADPGLRNEKGQTALDLTSLFENPIDDITERLRHPGVPPGLRGRK
jgi:ankyrin repeat protein